MGKYVIKDAKSGIKFDLKAGNGEAILSSQVYKTIYGCRKGVASVKGNAVRASIEDQTVEEYKIEKNPKFEVYTDKGGEFRFRLKATNGQIIGTSEGYKSKTSCMNGIASVRKNAESEIKDERALPET